LLTSLVAAVPPDSGTGLFGPGVGCGSELVGVIGCSLAGFGVSVGCS